MTYLFSYYPLDNADLFEATLLPQIKREKHPCVATFLYHIFFRSQLIVAFTPYIIGG